MYCSMARFAGVMERKATSAIDIKVYWENVPPLWQVRWMGLTTGSRRVPLCRGR